MIGFLQELLSNVHDLYGLVCYVVLPEDTLVNSTWLVILSQQMCCIDRTGIVENVLSFVDMNEGVVILSKEFSRL